MLRRGFFGRLVAAIGAIVLPSTCVMSKAAVQEPVSTRVSFADLQRRENQSKLGLGPNDVRVSFEWIANPRNGETSLAVYVDCHGESYGQLVSKDDFAYGLFIRGAIFYPGGSKAIRRLTHPESAAWIAGKFADQPEARA